MSFWDSLKAAPPPLQASTVTLSADHTTLTISFVGEATAAEVPARLARQLCPCAECVEEWTGRRTVDPDSIPGDTTIVEVQAVGNYALSFTFSDHHRTGIYKWDYLKALAEEAKRR